MSDGCRQVADQLLARAATARLMPDKPSDPALTETIDALDVCDAVKAGLHLLNDDLARSHVLAQSLQGDPTGDYWHAIIHRREGDWGNAQYWFRRVASHPVLAEVYGADPAAPSTFVDRCRSIGRGRDEALEAAQAREMHLLLDYAASHSV